MAFINEEVSESDIEKYSLRANNKSFLQEGISCYWTVDHENDIYLRDMGYDWQNPAERKFSFYWKGCLMRLALRLQSSEITGVGGVHQVWSVGGIRREANIPIPEQFENFRPQIVADLKRALLAYRGAGIFASPVEYTADFLF